MEWWLRFCLGLPCRKEDVKSIRQNFPEIYNSDLKLKTTFFWPFLAYFDDTTELLNKIKEWSRNIDKNENQLLNPINCPERQCPLKVQTNQTQEASSIEDREGISDTFEVLSFLILGGVQKCPKDAFLNLVRRSRNKASMKEIKEVIITDPYYLSDVNEDGRTTGGYSNMISYLENLSLTENSVFELITNPSPQTKNSEVAKPIFKRFIQEYFLNVSFSTYSPKYKFHDRFYLIRDNKSEISGVFGPSLNGLLANSIVLMGEIDKQALLALKKVFQQ